MPVPLLGRSTRLARPDGTRPPRVLLVYADRIGEAMGGMGIRAVELARVLRDELGAAVTIAGAAFDGGDVGFPVVTYAPHAPAAVDRLLADADAVVAQPGWPLLMRGLARSRARLVLDLYDPELFGTLEHFAHRRSMLRRLMGAFAVDRLVDALAVADHVMCASERQRDLWVGAMLGAGLIGADVYDRDPTLRDAIDVVPYGVPATPPVGDGRLVRERLGLDAADEIVLWNGGVWSWFDAPTAIRAVARLRVRRPRARLVFMGRSEAAPGRRATEEAIALARELGELGTGVLFHDAWVPYDERASWLLAADCAISTHADHLEARFAFRTRLLDCFWSGLPVVCTEGDELAGRVAREALGATAPPGDPDAIATALDRVLERGRAAFAAPLARAATDYAWPRVAQPLLRWLRDEERPPHRASGSLHRRPAQQLRRAAYMAGARTSAALRLLPPSLR